MYLVLSLDNKLVNVVRSTQQHRTCRVQPTTKFVYTVARDSVPSATGTSMFLGAASSADRTKKTPARNSTRQSFHKAIASAVASLTTLSVALEEDVEWKEEGEQEEEEEGDTGRGRWSRRRTSCFRYICCVVNGAAVVGVLIDVVVVLFMMMI